MTGAGEAVDPTPPLYTALADATYGITGLNWEVKAGLLLLFFVFVFVFFFLLGAHLPGNFFDQLGP